MNLKQGTHFRIQDLHNCPQASHPHPHVGTGLAALLKKSIDQPRPSMLKKGCHGFWFEQSQQHICGKPHQVRWLLKPVRRCYFRVLYRQQSLMSKLYSTETGQHHLWQSILDLLAADTVESVLINCCCCFWLLFSQHISAYSVTASRASSVRNDGKCSIVQHNTTN